MDKAKAISDFLESVENLSRLPLITGPEMNDLFGDEVAAAVADLNRHNREEQVCWQCTNRCCPIAGCELYAPQFRHCPIHHLRPVVCRLHFCHRFQTDGSSLIKELGDIFFDSLLAADRYGSPRVRLFDSPPLAATAPALIAVTSPWVKAVQEGDLDPEYAGKLIQQEADKYRIAHTSRGIALEVT